MSFLAFISLSIAVQVTRSLSFPMGDSSTSFKYIIPTLIFPIALFHLIAPEFILL